MTEAECIGGGNTYNETFKVIRNYRLASLAKLGMWMRNSLLCKPNLTTQQKPILRNCRTRKLQLDAQ
jgi:hypothetical protein